MKITSELLKLTAKIGLDLFIGSKRTDDAVKLLEDWFKKSAKEPAKEIESARAEATNAKNVREAIEEVATEAEKNLISPQLDELASSVSAGLDRLAADAAPKPAEFLEQLNEQLMNLRRGTYAVWLDLEDVCGNGPGRYCHFHWTGDSYRIRDFIGGRIFHPPGARVNEQNLQAVQLNKTAFEVWQASKGRVQCLNRYGLEFPVVERERWKQVLQLMSEVAKQFGSSKPGA